MVLSLIPVSIAAPAIVDPCINKSQICSIISGVSFGGLPIGCGLELLYSSLASRSEM